MAASTTPGGTCSARLSALTARPRWTLVLAAIDERPATPGVYGEWSIKDIIVHLSTRETLLLIEIASDRQVETPDPDDMTLREVAVKADAPAREIMAEFEETHRVLKNALAKTPKSDFEYGTPLRQRIDESTVFHYQEHNVHIRSWLRNRRNLRAQANDHS